MPPNTPNPDGEPDSVRPWPVRFLGQRAAVFAKRLVHRTWAPGPLSRQAFSAAYGLAFASREAWEWAWRSLVATPTFLSLCAVHGEGVSVEKVPYILGFPRIELGSGVRISGRLDILSGLGEGAVLRIGDGVFIGHGTTIAVRHRVEIGDYSSISGDCFIADSDGHTHTRLDVSTWDDRADVTAPVIIEDNVHVSRGCMILKGVRLGARSLLGAGAVIRDSVAPGTIVVGNPARTVGFRRITQRG